MNPLCKLAHVSSFYLFFTAWGQTWKLGERYKWLTKIVKYLHNLYQASVQLWRKQMLALRWSCKPLNLFFPGLLSLCFEWSSKTDEKSVASPSSLILITTCTSNLFKSISAINYYSTEIIQLSTHLFYGSMLPAACHSFEPSVSHWHINALQQELNKGKTKRGALSCSPLWLHVACNKKGATDVPWKSWSLFGIMNN